MLVLIETPAGYAIFKLLNEKKLKQVDNLYLDFETPESASQIVKLTHFEKFKDTTEALSAATAAIEGKLSKTLKSTIKEHLDKNLQETLLVADAKLGTTIKEKFNLQCLSNNAVQELMRCIRTQLDSLIEGLPKKEATAMALGLAHSLSRYKLKFSPDKLDIMVTQAVCLLDDIDKELNIYMMRCREWYGWHFPELAKIVTDNLTYVKVVKVLGRKDDALETDLSDILPEEIEQQLKEAAETSIGTEIEDDDILNIHNLCDQIIGLSKHREDLNEYIKARMMAIAPNLAVLMGELIGARLISHSGSLINLAKLPASSFQLLGAEKALFRALKTKKNTPKYGLIYHSSLVGQSSVRIKGKAARMLAAKGSLSARLDAFGEDDINFELGAGHKVKLEARLRWLEESNNTRLSGTGKAKAMLAKYRKTSEFKQYPAAADSTLPSSSKRKWSELESTKEELNASQDSPKPKKKKIQEIKEEVVESAESLPKKKKKKAKQEVADEVEVKEEPVEQTPQKKKKKKRSEGETNAEDVIEPTSEKKKKKKKKHSEENGDE